MPREWWAGVIKDYDGGTLMECHMHPTIDFLHIKDIISQQRAVSILYYNIINSE